MSKKEDRRFYVYAFLREQSSCNGKKGSPYYIGKGVGRRAWVKGGRRAPSPASTKNIVLLRRNLTESESLDWEQFYIAHYGRIDKNTGILRNLTDGGEGSSGWKASKETRLKMSRSKLGKPLPQKTRENMSRSLLGNQRFLGKKHKQETKKKMANGSVKYIYEFVGPDGEIYITDNAKELARQHNLNDGHLSQVVHGKRTHHKGWTGRIVEALR